MKVLMLVLGLCVVAFSQSVENWSGYGDTARVTAFYKDTCIYSKKFALSSMENMRVDAFFRDTAAAGYASDSVKFIWGYQTGHPSFTTTKSGSPVIAWSSKTTIDTVDMLTAANFALDTNYLNADGSFTATKLKIDTLSVTGWAYQSRNVAPEWDVYVRFWAKGLTGNRTTKKIDLVFQNVRRLAARAF